MSKDKGKPLNILVVDDQTDFVDGTLRREARNRRILLTHVTNLEDAVANLQEKGEKAFAGIILDVICLKTRKDEIPDPSFIGTAIKTCENKAPNLPRVILTGEPGTAVKVTEFHGGDEKIFIKEYDQIIKMFDFLVEESGKIPHIAVIKKYEDIFEIFHKDYLSHDAEQDLLTCLLKMGIHESTVIRDNLHRLRRIQEKIYLALNRINPNIVPTHLIEEKGPKCRDIMRHLVRNKHIKDNEIICRFSDIVYSFASDYGSHVPNTSPEYYPTKYTVQSLTFAMLDLLLWFKGVMEEHYGSSGT